MPIETCPICLRSYARLGPHLVVTHGVKNKEERKLLLAMESGRVNARAGLCPVPACNKFSNRLDRHIRTHSEVSVGVQDEALRFCKRRVCLSKLTALRASNPAVPMVSTLDLEEQRLMEEDPSCPQDPEDLEEECEKAGCKQVKSLLRTQVADLNKQVDTLKEVDLLGLDPHRAGGPKAPLLSRAGRRGARSLEEDVKSSPEVPSAVQQPPALPEEKPEGDGEKPSTSRQPQDVEEDQPHYPDQVVVLSERDRRGVQAAQGRPRPGTKLKENVGCQVYRIKKFLAVMSRGK
ncbi:unnamed protein product [Leuciscus chuanchicus]